MKLIIRSLVLTGLFLITANSTLAQEDEIELSEQEKELFNQAEMDTVPIISEESNYEIVIIEPGFNTWLQSVARPEGYYSQHFLENRNQWYVMEWNRRVIAPTHYDSQHYLIQIDYDPTIDYGYEVNYKLYYYFIYFQRKYNVRLGPYQPRI